MKKLLFIGLLTLLFSCKKDKSADPDQYQLTGQWEYRGTACFCAQVGAVPNIKPGNGNILVFADGSYKHIQGGQTIKTGTYSIVKDTLKDGTPVNRLVYDGDVNPANSKTFFRIENNKLTFYGEIPLAADGTEQYYERL